MLLKSDQVIAELERKDAKDPLVITPQPNLDLLRKSGAASIDLRLGRWFFWFRNPRVSHLSVQKGGEMKTNEGEIAKTHFVPFGKEFFLHPRHFVLAVTLEWVRLPGNLAGYVIGRSSWGRRGLIIATATGVHPGYAGCLTLELTNVGQLPISIKPGHGNMPVVSSPGIDQLRRWRQEPLCWIQKTNGRNNGTGRNRIAELLGKETL